MSKLLVDEECVRLAEHFAYGEHFTGAETIDLSEEIQRTVEGWFAERERLRTRAERDLAREDQP